MKRRITRKQLAEKLQELGFPISIHKLNRMCSPLVNQGPAVDAYWAGRPLYDEAVGIAWAESLLSTEPPPPSKRWAPA